MRDRDGLLALLRRIDGAPYPAYRDLVGTWDLGVVQLQFDRLQGDPFAAPSRVRLAVPTGIGIDISRNATRRRAAEDWLLRRFADGIKHARCGSGRSGEVRVLRPGPEVLERTALRLGSDGTAEIRLLVGMPAKGRRILGRAAWRLVAEELPRAAATVQGCSREPALAAHVAAVEDQVALRRQLRARDLVAFVADGSVLPRASGVCQSPLEDAVPFAAPDALRVTLDSPSGPVTGMGIPTGVTVITGGGFHGKSTLLQALQRGHLDHVPGDGRERVVSDPDTVKVRAEDGRRVAAVDVSAFLETLPGGQCTRPFFSNDASGSTSQAAALVESIEAGARVLLFDEDTSATNLMVRDERMASLIPPSCEPITPLVSRIRQIHDDWGVSTVLVVGGVGDYLAEADTVVLMSNFRATDATARAHAVAGGPVTPPGPLRAAGRRTVQLDSIRPTGRGRIRARSARCVEH
ncbi:MAG: ABC-ATPase domain-containing protein, partial [Myxococcota bacterium]|nr:ABC-ATPase domain-containing protein [Myxococcota bacterium]